MALSKIDTAAIAEDAIEAAQLKSDAVTAGDLPTGSVLQVVQTKIGRPINAVNTSLAHHSGATQTAWFDIKDGSNNFLSCAITPTSANSKILVNVSCSTQYEVYSNGHAGRWDVRILRNNTSIIGSPDGYRASYFYTGGHNRAHQDFSLQHLDSPATTSSITYKIQIRFDGHHWYYYGYGDYLTLMEIAG